VDLPRLYREAAVTQQGQTRRWRRRAAVVTGLAAALVLVLLGLRLEMRLDRHQLVLRWGSPPTEPAPPAPVLVPELPPEYASADTAEQLQVLRKLIHALAADVRNRDLRRQEQIAQLHTQVRYLEHQSRRQWTATQRDVDTLYAAQSLLTKRGAIP
jgi:hypothetical protein